ncbi:MAG: bacteriohopanetetrol glucosamine biosynthesis glycosyltransferase HpnI [Acidobacteria bacterium]|nr:bacteriohopanetetrol glucosamine biosynthesis glycosyltransferase HpnI [Acidobacteriota bacterium]MBS1865316.1 bacteriohopanetetrol glucosamine biosynthesis glycosyltransferase HpnI [Acidobacteriota bacterium]
MFSQLHPRDIEHAAFALAHYFVWLMFFCSLGFYFAAILAALRFSARKKAQRKSEFTPYVSVLKPVHGVDFGSEENFASFCTQNYANYEIIFAVNTESDPAVPLIRKLIAAHPERTIRLVMDAPFLGENRKVNNLALMAREASYEVLAITDGDVRVGPDYLRNVVAPFSDSETGAVTSLYRGVAERGFFSELEALGAASDFAAGVLVAERMEGLNFALGASIVTTKSWIHRIGGLEPIAHLLADDYELGHRISQAGGEVVLSNEVVVTMYPAQTLRGFWDHQLRWARTVRLCRPLSYLGLIFTHGLPWAVLAALLSPAKTIATACLVAHIILRFAVAKFVGVGVMSDETVRRRWWLIPLRDAIHFFIWLASFTSNRVTWGDSEFTMKKGQMIPVRTPR